MFSALLAVKRQNSAICRGPLVSVHPGGGKAFTLVELIATVAVVAMLAVVLVVFIGGYIQDAKRTADRQTLAVLNDALTRYKTQGGSLAALTSGASIGNVLTELQTPVTWAGMKHQFLKTGETYTAASISALGDGQQFKFTRYGDFADGTEYSNGILNTYAADGYDVGDEEEFKNWMAEAMAETGSTNYLALTNPDTTDRFGFYARVASSGDKVRVWWGDGTTSSYDSLSTSSWTSIPKVFSDSAKRTVVIIGDLGGFYSDASAGIGGAGASSFGGSLSTMESLTYLKVEGGHTASCNINNIHELEFLRFWSTAGSLSGDISNTPNLTWLECWSQNTITGDVSGFTNAQAIICAGSNTLTGDISGLVNLEHLGVGGSNTMSGDISGLTNLKMIRLFGSNTIYGTISDCPLYEIVLGGNSAIDVDDLVATTLNSTSLCDLRVGSQYTLTQTQVDTILDNFWTNRDFAKGSTAYRTIDINEASHAAPSAAGETTKANLEAYMSPSNTGPMVWTVNTN